MKNVLHKSAGFLMPVRKKFAFTLAEVLITLAIIGVVAAITIPSVIVNTNQMEFKTGLRKAVSVLNQAITMNKALTGESPYDNSDLFNYLQQNMSVMKSTIMYSNALNYAFYTTDGMRFEFYASGAPYGQAELYNFKLHENSSNQIYQKMSIVPRTNSYPLSLSYGNCGSMGLTHNQDNTTEAPCMITVDVNGDRKPSGYPDANFFNHPSSATTKYYKYADPNGRLLSDVFSIMITDTGAIPYGVVAQKAMYQAQK